MTKNSSTNRSLRDFFFYIIGLAEDIEEIELNRF